MTFPEALSAIFNDGDRLTRSAWRNRDAYLFIDDGKLCTTWNGTKADGLPHPLIVTEPDYFADDWETIDD